jgi:predicted RNA methylase
MKITRTETKKHDEALALLSLVRKLNTEEIEFVYENYNPMATNNVGKGAIFFTPLELARELAMNSESDGNSIDLAAGIGVLSFAHLKMCKPKRHVAIELNHEFVEIGKKLLPEIEWYEGNIFDQDLLRSIGTDFTVAISNPPYGNIDSRGGIDTSWMKTKGPAEMMAMEISLRMAYAGGVFIVPEKYSDYDIIKRSYKEEKCREVKQILKHFGNITFHPWDSGIYEDVKDQWQGVSPNVLILDIGCDMVEWEQRPYGFSKLEEPIPDLFHWKGNFINTEE